MSDTVSFSFKSSPDSFEPMMSQKDAEIRLVVVKNQIGKLCLDLKRGRIKRREYERGQSRYNGEKEALMAYLRTFYVRSESK